MTRRGYFITGTDTGVGKTFVAATLARRASLRNLRVFAFKPIETGCTEVDGELVGSDQVLLRHAAGGPSAPRAGLYRFRDPVAPLVASRATRSIIDLARIKAVLESTPCDIALVEGAGGWRVPITETTDMSDLAKVVGLPVLLVARAGLGTINHTLLSIEAIGRDNCELAAVVLSCHPADDLEFARENASEISRRWRGRVLLRMAAESSLDSLL
jgi:dethiobiotin synthetase